MTLETLLESMCKRMSDPSDNLYVKNFSTQNFRDYSRRHGILVQLKDRRDLFHVRIDSYTIFVDDKHIGTKGQTEHYVMRELYRVLRNTFITRVLDFYGDMKEFGWETSDYKLYKNENDLNGLDFETAEIITTKFLWFAIHKIASILENHLICND